MHDREINKALLGNLVHVMNQRMGKKFQKSPAAVEGSPAEEAAETPSQEDLETLKKHYGSMAGGGPVGCK